MKIGGLQPFTLSDFPGKSAAILFVIGCNFRCPFCYNHHLFDETQAPMPDEEVYGFLAARRNQLEGIVISGGEPTIYADLPEFIQKIKRLGFLVKLDTNGSHPACVRRLLTDHLIDYIAMDIKAPFGLYDRLSGVKTKMALMQESIQLILDYHIPHEFRTTWDRSLLTEEDIEEIKMLIPKGSRYSVQDAIL